jgi:hypothetical protein
LDGTDACLLYLELAAAASQERAATFEENFEVWRKVLRASPRQNQEEKQN